MKRIMVIVNKYDEVVCELERHGKFFHKVKDEDRDSLCTLLEEGDEFRVVSVAVDK